MLKRILFAADDPDLSMGLQLALHPMRTQWEMEFVATGEEALHALVLRPFDAVVAHMGEPGIRGSELLDEVQENLPLTCRILLSAHSGRASNPRSFSTAHQLLPVPCDVEHLKSLIESSMALTDLLSNASIKKIVSRLKSIPSLPLLFHEVLRELRSDEPSPSRLGKIIAQDMAMTAKLLQIVNSAAYGVRSQISEPSQAVLLLGSDTLHSMVLSLSIFSALDPHVLGKHEAEQLWERSASVSELSAVIARAEGVPAASLNLYRTAGLLRDIGKLVIASADADEYRRIEGLASSTGTDQCIVETELLGCNHAEIGAYLLGQWGLPASIVEAVAWHHHPSDSPAAQFSTLAAVHVASALQSQLHPEFAHWDPQLDLQFLERIGLAGHEDAWMHAWTESGAEAAPHRKEAALCAH